MVEWLNSVLDSIWGFIKAVWQVFADAVDAFWGWIYDGFIWLVMIPVRATQWVWEHGVLTAVQWCIDGFHNLPFNDFVAKLDVGGWNVGGLLVALVDFDLVITFAAGCMFWMASVAIIKFTIKLFPGIG